MLVTESWLREKGACDEGIRAYLHHYPDGADHNDILRDLSRRDPSGTCYAYARWLVDAVGRTKGIDYYTDYNYPSLFSTRDIVANGPIATGDIYIAGSLETGGLEARDVNAFGVFSRGVVKARDISCVSGSLNVIYGSVYVEGSIEVYRVGVVDGDLTALESLVYETRIYVKGKVEAGRVYRRGGLAEVHQGVDANRE